MQGPDSNLSTNKKKKKGKRRKVKDYISGIKTNTQTAKIYYATTKALNVCFT
jgi:hypothetical protein